MASMMKLPGLPDPGRCLVMGVVNVTPDSFSDGGRWFDPARAIEHGLRMADEGADIVDVGGESTRPGAQRVSLDEELRRVGPVVRELARQGVAVSVDTMRAEVADYAVEAGARLVNDVSGGLADPAMARLVAKSGVAYVLMHWRGHSHDMQRRAEYTDVVQEVHDELRRRMAAMVDEGADPNRIVLDPGLGFAKRPDVGHNWALLAHLDRFHDLGRPILVGGSRKRFLGRLLSDAEGAPRDFTGCDDATVALTALAAERGAWCVRVHDVRPNADAVRVAAAWRSGGAVLDEGRADPIGRSRP
ncbi:dihydropteroate synthase [Marinitenerispora sediminis]|uniref:Dihydropteroate synthase n=1 Tax=Marinitenerispora sediminis TaxID=1931232 RepID=A0A368T9H1_9ACTN|nr:dihydropteroate synthase [Marinitenerispora sediminis]RCV55159.1 dihydropteroate synthase [Marinitenerispora sediminis]RCV61245.1 dihydropteroate synthase [Marinitenerispora sediminis]RCV61516.1 dihydropteroate synthase [Marinitenerispora sediminis]